MIENRHESKMGHHRVKNALSFQFIHEIFTGSILRLRCLNIRLSLHPHSISRDPLIGCSKAIHQFSCFCSAQKTPIFQICLVRFDIIQHYNKHTCEIHAGPKHKDIQYVHFTDLYNIPVKTLEMRYPVS